MPSIAQAIRLALHVGETKLGVEEIFGQDVGPPLGGVFTCTQGLSKAWNTPLDERGIIGMCIGLALVGQKPVCEIQFCDYIFNSIDLLKLAGNLRWATHGAFQLPMVVMTPVGSGIHGSIYHSHSFESIASHIPGIKIVLPSNPLDAYGLLISSIIDPNPVLYLYPKSLIRVNTHDVIHGLTQDDLTLSQMIDAPLGDRSEWKPTWPDVEIYKTPIGQAKVVFKGDRLTLISYGRMLPLCLEVAKNIYNDTGHAVDVIDLRTLIPLDIQTISQSVSKTKRVLIVNEDTEITNFAEHVLRIILDHHFYELEVKPKVLLGKNTPGLGLAHTLETALIAQYQDIYNAIMDMLNEQA